MQTYTLTAAAGADLREVVRYTRRQWGEVQARRYAGRLRSCIQALATGEGAHRDAGVFYPGLRMARCDHHLVYCLPQTDAPVLIVAILHERMDLASRIEGRMG